ncbi:hypothetical protein [Streptomyces eurythermus]|uniref:hypothetical protein n=1 Tax=Streptomyces eurythermus TaxID=42237 RepID=UPI0033C3E584
MDQVELDIDAEAPWSMAPVTATRGLVAYRAPTPRDALPAWRPARRTHRTDSPGPHYYARWFRDFADTSLVAAAGRDVLGFLIGCRRPDALDTYFVLHTEAGPHHGTPVLGAPSPPGRRGAGGRRRGALRRGRVPPGNTAGTEVLRAARAVVRRACPQGAAGSLVVVAGRRSRREPAPDRPAARRLLSAPRSRRALS